MIRSRSTSGKMPPALGEARAVDLLHDEEVGPVRLAEVVEPHDVLVEQAGEDLRLEPDLLADFVAAAPSGP